MPIYREPLPENCPPEEAAAISRRRIVFRLVRNNPPTDADFRSQRAENPGREFKGITECQVRGLSVFTERRDAVERLKRPNLKGMLVCRVVLDRGAGRIQHTAQRTSHHTWWPLADYHILSGCLVEL